MAEALALVADDLAISPFRDRFVFVLSDGEPNDEASARRQIARLAGDGVSLVGLGLGPHTQMLQGLFPVSRVNLSTHEVPGALATLLAQSIRGA